MTKSFGPTVSRGLFFSLKSFAVCGMVLVFRVLVHVCRHLAPCFLDPAFGQGFDKKPVLDCFVVSKNAHLAPPSGSIAHREPAKTFVIAFLYIIGGLDRWFGG